VNTERGTITLWVLGLAIAMMFLGGLALDLWRAVGTRRELSGMADAAATAGANGVDESALRSGALRVDPTRARAVASGTLAQFGRSSALDGVSIQVNGDRVTVVLRDHVDFSLLGIFLGGDRFEVEARASAQPDERP
jgi:hypothetical protein